MNLFKSLPAVVSLLAAIATGALAIVQAVWPVAASLLPPKVIVLIAVGVFVLLVILHYEKLLSDGAKVIAGQAPLSTFTDDLKAALAEGFGNVIAALQAQAKADLASMTAAATPLAAVGAVVGTAAAIGQAEPAIAQAFNDVAAANSAALLQASAAPIQTPPVQLPA